MNYFLSDFMSNYRTGYSTNHVLIRLIENWKKALDNNLFTGTALMDLSKAQNYMLMAVEKKKIKSTN